MLGNRYQIALIALSAVLVGMFGAFIYRELFPEYKIYQEAYVALEDLRAERTGVTPPDFKYAIKQIVIPADDRGPETIDRCVSCHVAMKLSHFSPTKVAKDINGQPILDDEGIPVKIPNEDYVWADLDARIEAAHAAGLTSEAERLEGFKHVEVGHHHYDMTKVLAMHPLIGRETIPFEFHPLEEYGCTSCHSGNGRGLVTDRAHGPVYDGQYHEAAMGPEPEFTEHDPDNDPSFTRAFNHKPGHRLLFQTTPILVGDLMQAKCVQCHQTTKQSLEGAVTAIDSVARRRARQLDYVRESVASDRQALESGLSLLFLLDKGGLQAARSALQEATKDFTLPDADRSHAQAQLERVQQSTSAQELKGVIQKEFARILGDAALADSLLRQSKGQADTGQVLDQFLQSNADLPAAEGSLFAKQRVLEESEEALKRIALSKQPLVGVLQQPDVADKVALSTDHLTRSYQRGEELFRSSACYACHRISGYSRGGVGPELSDIGLFYPWYIKEAIVWPQGNLPSSTMPNYKLDTEEVQDLMTFLLAQRGENQAVSTFDQAVHVKEWDAGQLMPWEKPVRPDQILDVHNSQIIFATEGCSACHRLKGYDSAVGFAVEKESTDFATLWAEKEWFKKRIPDELAGSILVQTLEKYADEFDQRIVADASEPGILEELQADYPRLVEALYTNFKFAERAKNKHYNDLIAAAKTEEEAKAHRESLKAWKERVHRVLMVYIQEYGLGRHIGPLLHWSGVYRDTEWLVGHFRNPGSHTAKSIMPVLPFDDTKFYALTHMLQVMGQQNRDEVRQIWNERGFDPELAYEMHCSACHGQFMAGNGPVAEWIYPIPKNLRNATFLRNLTRDRAIQSIVHGVLGGPMAPWGEAPDVGGQPVGEPVLKKHEITQLVDWLYQSLPGSRVIRGEEDVQKWQYTPEDILDDLEREGHLPRIQEEPREDSLDSGLDEAGKVVAAYQANIQGYYAALEPELSKPRQMRVEDLFDIVRNPYSDAPEDQLYYLKRDFFTAENISEGERLFIANCAHCHGKEGGGNGDRATSMQDAKPRMLANLPWLRTRDDLRILRSIKYGVAGTSMTPWGDKTDSMQRLQIVTYIRHLTNERRRREDLISELFQAFEEGLIAIESARASSSKELAQLERSYTEAVERREALYLAVQEGQANAEQASAAYAQELSLLKALQSRQGKENALAQLGKELLAEQSMYEKLGRSMIAKGVEESVLEEYLRALSANAGRFEYLDGQLSMAADAQSIERIERRGRAVLTDLDRKIARLETALEQVRGQLRSQARSSKENQLKTELDGVRELRAKLINLIAESQRSLTRQTELYQAFQESTANVPGAQTESSALQEFKEMTKQKTAEIDRVTEGEAVTW